MANLIKEQKDNLNNVVSRIKKRDFSGYTGLAIKNSIFQFAQGIVSKLGSVIFTVVMARILMPELFGLYSLALATILLFVTLSDLGTNQTIVKFTSSALASGDYSKAKAYAWYLLKIKALFILLAALLLAIFSKFISQNYYQKPITLALLAGAIYIICVGFVASLQLIFQALNDFKVLFWREILFQVIRIFVVPIVTIVSMSKLSVVENASIPILALTGCWFIVLISFYLFIRNKTFFKTQEKKLTLQEKKEVNSFSKRMFFFGLSGFLFGYLDMIFLGRYVSAESIGFYQIAMGFISSSVPLIAFSTVLFPIFSRLQGDRLKAGFDKSVRLTVVISLILSFLTWIFAPIIIYVYGSAKYLPATPFLQLLSVLMIIMPLISLYSNLLTVKGDINALTIILALTTIFNLLSNYFLITWLVNYNDVAAVYGSCIATILSSFFYLSLLILRTRKIHKNSS